MRFYFLHAGLLEPLEAVDPCMPNLVRTLESGPGNTASGHFGL